jgi:hypothetical protein
MIGPDNLTALAAFCNTLFYYFEVAKTRRYKKTYYADQGTLFRLSRNPVDCELWVSTAPESVASADPGRDNMAPD